jgi:superfamily II DNA/RNA helicase
VYRFSPISNKKAIPSEQELRVLIATDVLSEGQNLQDGFIIINYDLPWTIIRLIQRAGRVDRIGQRSDKILCYSFLPAEGMRGNIERTAQIVKNVSGDISQFRRGCLLEPDFVDVVFWLIRVRLY